MADLGAIGNAPYVGDAALSGLCPQYSGPVARERVQGKHLAVWAACPTPSLYPGSDESQTLLAIPSDGSVSGNVTAAGLPVPDCIVVAIYRVNGNWIGMTRTNDAGEFTIDGLEPGCSDYFFAALDPDGGMTYNAARHDRVTAV